MSRSVFWALLLADLAGPLGKIGLAASIGAILWAVLSQNQSPFNYGLTGLGLSLVLLLLSFVLNRWTAREIPHD